ncbi:MAG: nitronate monooxygenase [Ignavibacteria bacterium]|jgi:nitronate monooxygenase
MFSTTIPNLKIGNLEVQNAIIQGGMGVGISLAGLAAAVSNEGGIGVISSIGLGLLYPELGRSYKESNEIALRREIKKAKILTDGILGLNIMYAVTDFDALLKVALEEEIDIIFIGAGLPLKIPDNMSLEMLQNIKTKIVPIVSSARAANIIFSTWTKKFNHVPDAVVVEGPLAGGHLGFKKTQITSPEYALEDLLPGVMTTIMLFEKKFNKKIPVIAAGGIYSGADIYKFIQLGADGVQMGTRFVATHECDASPEFKNQYVKCTREDIGIIESPVGLPGRGIINRYLKDVSAGEKKPFKCPFKCLKTCDYKNAPYCIALALTNAQKGKLKNGFAFCGQNAFKVEQIISVKKLMNDIKKEYETEAMFRDRESYKSLQEFGGFNFGIRQNT